MDTPQEITAIEKSGDFGSRDQVKELQTRIVNMLPSLMPNAAHLTHEEALGLAQVALLHGLSPFTGEIYYLKSSDRSLGVMPGIRGYRKAAKRQLPSGETYWLEYANCAANETGVQNPEDAYLAVKCTLRDSISMKRYTEIIANVAKIYEPQKVGDESQLANMRDEMRAIAGPPPLYIGFGVIMKYELARLSQARLNPLHQAKIRAERAAIRQRFDLDIVKIGGEHGEDDESEVSILDETVEPNDVIDVAASPSDQVDALFPQARPSEDLTQNVDIMGGKAIQHLVDLKLFENGFSAATVLGRFSVKKMPLKRLEEMATDYRDWKVLLSQTVQDEKEATSQAIVKVNAGEKPNMLPGI